jgi:hypothetical protein
MMELTEHSRMVIDELIDVMGRASIEAVLEPLTGSSSCRPRISGSQIALDALARCPPLNSIPNSRERLISSKWPGNRAREIPSITGT